MPNLRVRIQKDSILRLYGPLKARIVSGSINILGAELGTEDTFRIERERSYSVKAIEDSELDLKLDRDARIESSSNAEEPLEDWILIADKIIKECKLPCKIVITGPVESGKTSFAAVIANRSLLRGILPAIIDADIGQADIGPPGFVSLAIPHEWVFWTRQLVPLFSRFIGSIEPSPVIGRVISSTQYLVEKSIESGAGIIAIDTDGWVNGWNALEYKVDLIASIDADAVVVLGDPLLYNSIIQLFKNNVYYARSPMHARIRSREDRKRLRRENYRKFLEDSIERKIIIDKVKIIGSCLLLSVPQNQLLEKLSREINNKIIHVGAYRDGYCIVVDANNAPDSNLIKTLQKKLGQEILVLYTGGFSGVLVGLRDPVGSDHPGIVKEFNIDRKEITVMTKYTGEITSIIFGRLKLDSNFNEITIRRIWI